MTTTAAPCIAVSSEADFEAGTWTFSPIENFVVGAGRYAILPKKRYDEIIKQRDDLLAAIEAVNVSAVYFAKNEYSISADAISKVENAIASVKGQQ